VADGVGIGEDDVDGVAAPSGSFAGVQAASERPTATAVADRRAWRT
jgi:hypothetical protein